MSSSKSADSAKVAQWKYAPSSSSGGVESAKRLFTSEAMATTLSALQSPSDLEVAALRQQAAERIKAKADGIALKRPLLSPELSKLPTVNVDIQFNPDTPVIRPDSYRALGRIADALSSPALVSYTFLM